MCEKEEKLMNVCAVGGGLSYPTPYQLLGAMHSEVLLPVSRQVCFECICSKYGRQVP
jgi:hypothetical protein